MLCTLQGFFLIVTVFLFSCHFLPLFHLVQTLHNFLLSFQKANNWIQWLSQSPPSADNSVVDALTGKRLRWRQLRRRRSFVSYFPSTDNGDTRAMRKRSARARNGRPIQAARWVSVMLRLMKCLFHVMREYLRLIQTWKCSWVLLAQPLKEQQIYAIINMYILNNILNN